MQKSDNSVPVTRQNFRVSKSVDRRFIVLATDFEVVELWKGRSGSEDECSELVYSWVSSQRRPEAQVQFPAHFSFLQV